MYCEGYVIFIEVYYCIWVMNLFILNYLVLICEIFLVFNYEYVFFRMEYIVYEVMEIVICFELC